MNSSSNNSNNDNQNENEFKNTILFFKIWRNLYLKKIIIFEIKLLNIHHFKRIYNLNKFIDDSDYKYKDYLRSIELNLAGTNSEPWKLKKLNLPRNIEELDMGIGGDFRNQPQGKQLKIPNDLKIKTFKFSYRYQGQIKPEFITPHLKTLILSYSFNQPLHQVFNSSNNSNLTSLNLGCDYDAPIQEGALPPNLKYLKLSDRFNYRLVAGTLPSSLLSLSFGNDFNQPLLPLDLPPNLTYIHFGNNFDQPLTFSNQSKRVVPVLPSKLEYVRFGVGFSQHIDEGSLPDSLKTLIRLDNYMVAAKKKLKFHPSPNLTKLVIGGAYLYDFKYPKSIKDPKLSKIKISNLNKHTKNFDLAQILPGSVISASLEFSDFIVKKNTLPSSLKKLKVSPTISFEPNSIPSSLTEIHGCHPDYIKRVVPSSVTKYILPSLPNDTAIDSSVLQSLPKNITHLKVDNFALFGSFISMDHIVTLILEPVFDFEAAIKPDTLPPKLLNLSWGYASKILPNTLPQTIQLLELGSRFNQSISTEWLPSSLAHLIVKGRGLVESLPSSILGLYTFCGNSQFLEHLDLTPDIINILYVLNADYNSKLCNIFKKLLNKDNINK